MRAATASHTPCMPSPKRPSLPLTHVNESLLILLLPNKHAASDCPHEHSNKPTNHKQKKQSFSGPAVRGYHSWKGNLVLPEQARARSPRRAACYCDATWPEPGRARHGALSGAKPCGARRHATKL
jgi:hypothetical protein